MDDNQSRAEDDNQSRGGGNHGDGGESMNRDGVHADLYVAVQTQKPVTAYLNSKQLLACGQSQGFCIEYSAPKHPKGLLIYYLNSYLVYFQGCCLSLMPLEV